MADEIKEEPPKKGLIRGLLGRKGVPKSQKKEKEREDNAWKKKLFGYLEGFKKSFAVLEAQKGDKKKGGLFSGLLGMVKKLFPAGMLAAIPAALMGMLGTFGLGVLVLGGILAIVQRVKDAFGGWAKAEAGEWGNIDKISGWIGGFLGGKGSGLWNALMVGGTWAVTGMMAGIAFGPPGIIIGGIIGAVIGGILGWIGGQKIANWVDGTVKKLRSIFDLPEALSEEQKALAEKDVAQAKADLMKAADNISMYKLELANEATTYQRRIELRRLIAAEEKVVEDKKDTIRTESRRLAESQLGDMDKELKAQQQSTLAASMGVQRATELKNQAWLKVIWAKAIHGKGSEEHDAAVAEYDDRVLAVSDAKKNLEDNKTKMATMRQERSDLRTELDKEHKTAMGNVRLFFKGETDWQNNLKSGWTNMIGTIKTWFKDNIYDPGSTGGPPGSDTPLRIFGIEMKWPKMSFPSWQEIKAALPWWLGGGGKEGGVTKVFTDHFKEWSWELPKWSDIKAKLPNWLGGSLESAGSALKGAGETVAGVASVFGNAFNEWKLDVPSWAETKKSLPTWLGGEGSVAEAGKLWTDAFDSWEFKLPAWADIKKELPWWLGGGTDETKTTLQAFKDEFGAGWTFNIPTWASIKSFIPTWLGGTKGESPEEQAKLEFNKWTFKFPTWAEISAFLPDWIKDPVGWIKGIFKKGDEEADLEKKFRKDKKKAAGREEDVQERLGEIATQKAGLGGKEQESIQWAQDQAEIGRKNAKEEIAALKVQIADQEKIRQENIRELEAKKLQLEGEKAEEKGFISDIFTRSEQNRLDDLAEIEADLKRAREATTPTGRGSLQARLETKEGALAKIDRTEASRIEAAKQKTTNTLELLNMEQLGLEKESAVNQRLMTTSIEKLVKEATAPSESLRVHDVHLERLLAPVPVQLGALLGSLGALNSGGGTTVNNVTVAPSTSNSVSSVNKSENTYGTVDPYTAAAGAYG